MCVISTKIEFVINELVGRLKGRGKRLRIDEVLAERSAVPAVATHLRAARVPSLSKAESAVLKKIASKKLKMDKVVESDAPKNIWASGMYTTYAT